MQTTQPKTTSSLAHSASLLSIGNAASRILGLLREVVIAYYFGASGQVSAFRIASQVPTLLYDFLVGGMLSAALIPVLSDYAQTRSRDEFLRLIGALLNLLTLLLVLLVLILELTAPWIAWLLAAGFDEFNPELLPLTIRLIRIVAPAVWLFSMGGALTAILYALQRFSFPAIATAVYNLGIVLSAPLLANRLGVTSLAIGILIGSCAQFLLMQWDLQRWRRSTEAPSGSVHLSLFTHWYHPALRQMLWLYLPIAGGLVISILQIILDRRLASSTGEQSIAWMANATTLQQLPLGLISVAISLAALPKLSQYFAAKQEDAYRETLGHGLRMVLLLIIPAAVGLWLLGEPLTRLLFQRNQFTPQDTNQVVQALNIYLLGMVFAAIDFPLNYAFYARSNTWLPALVGVFSVGVYVVMAFVLIEPLGYLGLVWADSAKQASHAVIMIGLLLWQIGRLRTQVGQSFVQMGLGAAVMALVIWGISIIIKSSLPAGVIGDMIHLLIAGGAGSLVYLFLLKGLGLSEVDQLWGMVKSKIF